jgi:hypothetical protein
VAAPEGRAAADFAYDLAVHHSVKSSRPLNRAELHAAILRLATLHAEWSQRDVASFVGVAHTTVGRVLARRLHQANGASDGDQYIARVAAEQLALRLFRGMEKVWEARGLGLIDALVGYRTAERLADVLRDSFGDDALDHAQRYRAWIDGAIAKLQSESA